MSILNYFFMDILVNMDLPGLPDLPDLPPMPNLPKLPDMPANFPAIPNLPQISDPLKVKIVSQIQQILSWMEAVALFAAIISGFIHARRHRFDAVSTFIIGFVSAFGGGTLRDILLDRRPFYWVAHEEYAIAVFILSLIAPFAIRVASKLINEFWFNAIDAVGVGLFTVAGTAIAMDAGMPPFIATILGVMTAVFGGVIRDILLNQIPWLLTNKEPYASCAFVGACLFIFLKDTHMPELAKLLLSSGAVVVLRMWASYFKVEYDLFIFKK